MPIQKLNQPPGQPDASYVLPIYGGELWTIPTSNSVMRMLVTEKESKGDFAIVSTGGQEDKPIGFHYHKEAHDVFLCTKGSMNVWADDQARTLYPGDFASVPPNTIHQYQILGSHTEFAGLIIPGGWEEFFRFIGEPYAPSSSTGPLFPTRDTRNPFEVLIPKLIAATEKFDMIPCREHKGGVPVACGEQDTKLPSDASAYFLKGDAGPKYAAGGLLTKPLALPKNTNGKFAIARLEGSDEKSQHFSTQPLTFTSSHHAFLIDMGTFTFTINGETTHAATGETVFVPAGAEFSFKATGRYSAAYVFCSGGGLVDLLVQTGREYKSQIIAEGFEGQGIDGEVLKGLQGVKIGGGAVNGHA